MILYNIHGIWLSHNVMNIRGLIIHIHDGWIVYFYKFLKNLLLEELEYMRMSLIMLYLLKLFNTLIYHYLSVEFFNNY